LIFFERRLLMSNELDRLKEAEDLLEGVTGFDIPDNLGELLGLIAPTLGVRSDLYEVISSLVPGEQHLDLRRALHRVFTRKIDAQSGSTGAQMLQRCITKTIDSQVEHSLQGAGLEVRLLVSQEMADNACRSLLAAAAALHAYPRLAAAVVAAKEAEDAAAMSIARRERTAGVELLRKHFLNSARAITGDDTK
jgi:hypothetical protein